jgi:hypothetical protein
MTFIAPNELAGRLGVDPKTFRQWLRDQKDAKNPLVVGHLRHERWEFTPEIADELVRQYRSRSGRPPPRSSPAVQVPPSGSSRGSFPDRLRTASTEHLEAALSALDQRPHQIKASLWPGELTGLDTPGLYSWWVDADGARDLTGGLSELVQQGRIYAGQTGATKWPSGKTGRATLGSRIGSQHVRGRIRSSTIRLTLAAALIGSLGLRQIGPSRLDPESERALSGWIAAHLEVGVHPFPDADVLGALEDRVLARLDPPLNLDGRPPTPLRTKLSALRRMLVGPVLL